MSQKLAVVVTGGTGKQGDAVVKSLLERGHEVRAVTRSTESATARELANAGVTLVRAALEDTAALTKALEGATSLFAMMPLPPGIFAGSGTDSITVGVHVGGDRQAIDHSIFVPEIFDHTIAPEFPSAINGITRGPVPDATLAIDAASRSFGDVRFGPRPPTCCNAHSAGIWGTPDVLPM